MCSNCSIFRSWPCSSGRRHQALYYIGPTDLYLKVPTGEASRDLLSLGEWAAPGDLDSDRVSDPEAGESHRRRTGEAR